MSEHTPVLLNEVLESFREVKLYTFFDATLGAAEHAKAILENHPEIEKFIGTDQDLSALELSKKKLEKWNSKIELFHKNFVDLDQVLKEKKVDGFLFDVGVSSMQLNSTLRGFSFRKEGPLDMRMDKTKKLKAETVINKFSEKDLAKIFKEYGEEPAWKKAAKTIVERRKKTKIQTTKELAEILAEVCRRKKHLHPATRVFQALRIFVNDELNVLEKALKKAIDSLKKGGVIVVISFHSLEDRIVKNVFRDASKKQISIYGTKQAEAKLQLITKKPIVPVLEEVKKNPRARSAKLRVAQRL